MLTPRSEANDLPRMNVHFGFTDSKSSDTPSDHVQLRLIMKVTRTSKLWLIAPRLRPTLSLHGKRLQWWMHASST
jgi:hypothetical protein